MDSIEYDTMARLEDRYWWYLGLRSLVRGVLQSELGEKRSLRILDAGCGTGGVMAMLSRAFPGSLVVGIDIAPAAIRCSAQRNAGHVVRGSVSHLPFQAGTFDVVLFIDLLYIEGVDDAVALEEARRVLRPGGLVVANVPAFEWLRGAHDIAVSTRHRYRRDELQQLLTTHGFTVNRAIYWNALLFPLVFIVRRLLRPGGGVIRPRSDLFPLPRSLNWLLTKLVAVDTWVCATVSLPFGTSVFSVAFKVQ